MRNRLSFFVAAAVLVTACADMSTPSTPSASTAATTQSSPVPGRDNSNNPGSNPTPAPNPNPTPGSNPGPNESGRVELKGAMAGRTGGCPAITFSVGTSTVMTNAATVFDDGACTTLQNGVQVEVEGVRQSNGVVLANRVENKTADDDDDDDDDDDNDDDRHGGEARLDGSIGGLGGACPAITFSVSGSTVSTSASTRFDNACGSLKNGDRVEVRGVRQANNVVAASRVEKKK